MHKTWTPGTKLILEIPVGLSREDFIAFITPGIKASLFGMTAELAEELSTAVTDYAREMANDMYERYMAQLEKPAPPSPTWDWVK